MYYILESNNGQPILFYQEGHSVVMYSINMGRVVKHGTVFNNVSENLHIINGLNLLYYVTTKNEFIAYTMNKLNLRESFVISCEKNVENYLYNGVEYNNGINVYYCCHNLTNSKFSIRQCRYTTFYTDMELLSFKKHIDNLQIDIYNNLIFLQILFSETDYEIYTINADDQISLIYSSIDSPKSLDFIACSQVDDINDETRELKNKLNLINAQYSDLSEYVKSLQDEIKVLNGR